MANEFVGIPIDASLTSTCSSSSYINSSGKLSQSHIDTKPDINLLKQYVKMLGDNTMIYDKKLKIIQELSSNLEFILKSTEYPQCLEQLMSIFVQILKDGQPQYIAEYPLQQVIYFLLLILYIFMLMQLDLINLKKYVFPPEKTYYFFLSQRQCV